jgi:hypothetical protein
VAQRLGRRAAPHLLVVAVLLAVALVLAWRLVVSGHPTSSVLCQCGDPGQTVWFLEWVPWALGHGHNPLFTDAMFAGQGGANLLQSTSYLLPALVLSPVTVLFGPTAAFNVAAVAAPVLSGWCMFLAARRVSTFFPGQLLAALLWAFSPLLVQNEMFGHLNYTVLYFPPLLFCVLHELATGDGNPIAAGALGGLLVAAQFFTGTEPLALTALAAVVGSLVAIALSPRAALERWRRLLAGVGSGAVVALVLLGYPMVFLLTGPRHVVGQPWPGWSIYGQSARAVVTAAGSTGPSGFSEVGGYYGPTGPGFAFLGVPLLVFLAASALAFWRRRVAWAVAVSGAFAYLCSLGTYLLPLGASSSQAWLPWRYLRHLPLMAAVGPGRFVMVVDAAAALLLAISLDSWVSLGRDVRRRLSRQPAILGGAVAVALCCLVGGGVAAAAAPLVTTEPFPLRTHGAPIPAWFRTASRRVRPSTVVLTYPYASSGDPAAMYWQAQEGLPFRLAGGRALVPGADGVHSIHVDPLKGFDLLLDDVSFGIGLPPAPGRSTVTLVRGALRRWGVDTVVVVPQGNAPAWMAAVLTESLGVRPAVSAGALVWSAPLLGRAPLSVRPSAVERCAGDGSSVSSLLRAPGCVLQAAARP